MSIDLLPSWCLTDESVKSALDLDDWMVDGVPMSARTGDDWTPGEELTVTRRVTPLGKDPADLRRTLGLGVGQVVGVAARWSCRHTFMGGVHEGGPFPVRLDGETVLTLNIPADIAGTIELETCLIVIWTTSDRPVGSCPDGSILWSDSWQSPIAERTLLLEGDESRIPVRSLAFDQRFGRASSALWAIDLDSSISLDDRLPNVVTVLLNEEVTARDFRGVDGRPDVSKIPDATLVGIKVDLLRSLTSILQEELEEGNWENLRDLADFEDGSVGQAVGLGLIQAFGSTASAVNVYRHDVATFDRELWNLFAPKSWNPSK